MSIVITTPDLTLNALLEAREILERIRAFGGPLNWAAGDCFTQEHERLSELYEQIEKLLPAWELPARLKPMAAILPGNGLEAFLCSPLDSELLEQATAAIWAALSSTRRTRGGSVRRHDPAADQKMVRDWQASGLTRAQFEQARGLEAGTVAAASDRLRKRR